MLGMPGYTTWAYDEDNTAVFMGSVEQTFEIVDANNLKLSSITTPTNYPEVVISQTAYNFKKQFAKDNKFTDEDIISVLSDLKVSLNGKELVEGTDYDISVTSIEAIADEGYKFNVEIEGKDPYTSTLETSFVVEGFQAVFLDNSGNISWPTAQWLNNPSSINIFRLGATSPLSSYSLTYTVDNWLDKDLLATDDSGAPKVSATKVSDSTNTWSCTSRVLYTQNTNFRSPSTLYPSNYYIEIEGMPNSYAYYVYSGDGLKCVKSYIDSSTPIAPKFSNSALAQVLDTDGSEYLTATKITSDDSVLSNMSSETGSVKVVEFNFSVSDELTTKMNSLVEQGFISSYDGTNTTLYAPGKVYYADMIAYDLSADGSSYSASNELANNFKSNYVDADSLAEGATVSDLPHGAEISMPSVVVKGTSTADVIASMSVMTTGFAEGSNFDVLKDTYAKQDTDYKIEFYRVGDNGDEELVTELSEEGTYKVKVSGLNSIKDITVQTDFDIMLGMPGYTTWAYDEDNTAVFMGSVEQTFTVAAHSAVSEWTNDPTSHWNTCSFPDCNDESHIYNKADHAYGDWNVTKEPDCTNTGSKIHACTVCGYEQTEEIAALGHDFSDWKFSWTGNESCTASRTCTRCDITEEVEAESITAVVTKKPTTSEKGETTYTATFPAEFNLEAQQNTVADIDPTTYQTTYRLYNKITGEHLFTADYNEYIVLPTLGGDWVQEGQRWKMPTKDDSTATPVYRLYNTVSGDHLYTTDDNEISTLTGDGYDWIVDCGGEPIFYSADKATGVPIYRLFTPSLAVGSHHFTEDANEYNTLPTVGDWQQEGVKLYALELFN
jgi:hypothetical protein